MYNWEDITDLKLTHFYESREVWERLRGWRYPYRADSNWHYDMCDFTDQFVGKKYIALRRGQ